MKNQIHFRYFWKEGIQNIFIHGFMSFAAMSVIFIMLLITGSVALFSYNIDHQIFKLKQDSEIVVYISEDFDEAQTKSIGEQIRRMDNVEQAVFESRADALEQFRKRLGENSDLLDGFNKENNPLRDAYHITMKHPEQVAETSKALKALVGVANMRVNESTITKLVHMQRLFQMVSITMVVVLGMVSVFIISNTVKLAMFARRGEIAIQKMVGATNWFIRWPFVIEGMVLGVVAGVCAFFMQWVLYDRLALLVVDMLPSLDMLSFTTVWGRVLMIYLLAGVLIGIGGSVFSIRRFMDV